MVLKSIGIVLLELVLAVIAVVLIGIRLVTSKISSGTSKVIDKDFDAIRNLERRNAWF